MINAPKVGTCYCGCGEFTNGHFATGHDARATSMLHYLSEGSSFVPGLILAAGYGPNGKNLSEAAKAAGWKPRN